MISSQYLAGFIDGEGNISLRKFNTTTGYKIKFRIVVRIANTNFKILKQIQAQYGGHIEVIKSSYNRKEITYKWKRCYRLVLTDRKATLLLRDVFPYLIIKKEHASYCLELAKMSENLKARRTKQGFFVRATKQEVDRKLELFEKVKILNARGRSFLGA